MGITNGRKFAIRDTDLVSPHRPKSGLNRVHGLLFKASTRQIASLLENAVVSSFQRR